MTALPDVDRFAAWVASPDVFLLGEGPVWDAPRGRLLWVDVDAGAVHEGRLDGDSVVRTRSHHLDRTVGAVVCSDAGDLLVAGTHALMTLTAAGDLVPGPDIRPPDPRWRLNDGACDPSGAFLVGTMALDGAPGGEALVRVGPGGTVTVLDEDLTLSNGLGWTTDGTQLYSVDSVPGVVWVRSYDAATGEVGPRQEWLRMSDGIPDGLCVDATGQVYIAIWGGGQIRRYAPDARLTGIVDVPAPHTTSMAFVGEDRDLLLITTATAGLTPDQRVSYPDSGRLFLARVGATAAPSAAWSGP